MTTKNVNDAKVLSDAERIFETVADDHEAVFKAWEILKDTRFFADYDGPEDFGCERWGILDAVSEARFDLED